MIRAWRIVKNRYVDQAFDGEGARLHGGRWNSPGYRAVYVSESRALATLEVLAGLGSESPLINYSLIGVRFDEDLVSVIGPPDLPEGWDTNPPGPASQAVGDLWLAEQRSVVLRVPSVIVPAENNYILNPSHPGFTKLVFDPPEQLRVDPRLRLQ